MENIKKWLPIIAAIVIIAIYFFRHPKPLKTIEKESINHFQEAKHHRFTINGLMSTKIDLHIIAKPDQDVEKIKLGLISELSKLEKIFNPYDPKSELSLVNKNAFEQEILLSTELENVIKAGIKYSVQSKGVFDITILPLVHLWKVTDKKNLTTPSEKEIQDVLKLVDYKNVKLDSGQIRFLKNGMAIGLGGIAKGYIIDKGIDYLKSQGIENALLNIGGDLYALGHKPDGEKWVSGIQHPRKAKSQIGLVIVENLAVATSGDYERYRMSKSGKRFHHILNTKTGYPTESKCISVTITASRALDADAIATIVFILGPKKGLEFIENNKGVEGLILFEEENNIKWLKSTDFNFQSIVK